MAATFHLGNARISLGAAIHCEPSNSSQEPAMRLTCLFVSFVSFVVPPLCAQQVTFVPHDINPASEYPACAVLDVNKDGKLDIASGGYWYEAPTWKKHFLREVE